MCAPLRFVTFMERESAVIMVGDKVVIFILFFWFNPIFACNYFLVFHKVLHFPMAVQVP